MDNDSNQDNSDLPPYGRDPYNRTRHQRDSYGRIKRKGPNALLIACVVIAAFSTIGGLIFTLSPQQQAARTSANFDTRVETDPRVGPVMIRLKTAFPKDYQDLKTQILDADKSGATKEQIVSITTAFMTRFMATHRRDMAYAPSENLKAIRDSQLAAYYALQSASEDQCALLFRTGSERGQKLDPKSLSAMGNLTAASIDAIIASQTGRTAQNPRMALSLDDMGAAQTGLPGRESMTTSDQRALLKEFRRNGVTDAQLALLADSQKLLAASSHDQCAIGIIIAKSMTTAPAELADKAMVEQIIGL